MIFYRASILCLLILLLSACAIVPPAARVELGYEQRAEQLLGLGGWTLVGRASIRTGDESGTVSLNWLQEAERYRVDLRAPWGAGRVLVNGGPGAVTLRTADGTEVSADAPGELLAHYTGFELPIEALRYWLLGVPDPAAESSVALDEQGLIRELRQHGWRVDYRRYGDFDGWALPNTLFMSGENVEVRVAIQRWTVEE